MNENQIYQLLELPVSYFSLPECILSIFMVGVTMGMTILYAFLRPFEPVLLFLIIPMPVVVAVGAFVAYDLYRAVTHRQGNIGSAGHIGGAIAGTLFYFLKIRGRL
jgi:membrane associated rhomboid family serine protease